MGKNPAEPKFDAAYTRLNPKLTAYDIALMRIDDQKIDIGNQPKHEADMIGIEWSYIPAKAIKQIKEGKSASIEPDHDDIKLNDDDDSELNDKKRSSLNNIDPSEIKLEVSGYPSNAF